MARVIEIRMVIQMKAREFWSLSFLSPAIERINRLIMISDKPQKRQMRAESEFIV